MAGHQMEDSLEKGSGFCRVAHREEVIEGARMQFCLDVRLGEQRFDFGRESELSSPGGPDQRGDSKAVSREQKLPAFSIPQSKRELTIEARENVRAPDAIAVEDYLHVAPCGEAGSLCLELVPKPLVVVYFAVTNQDEGVADERLVSVFTVDDGEPLGPQRDTLSMPHSPPIWSPVNECVDHCVYALSRSCSGDACYSAHIL
jgi:hypothetical protein